MSKTITLTEVKIAGAIWNDYLDPMATAMQAELRLGECESRTRGRGWTAVYRDVPVDVARELADYLSDRAGTLLSQDDDGMRSAHYAAIKAADRIRAEAADAELTARALRLR